MRLIEKIGDTHLLVVHWVAERHYRVGNFGNENHEQKNVGNIELPGSPPDLRRHVQRAFCLQPATVDKRGGEPGNKDEYFGCIKKCGSLQGEITQNVFRNVIDKNQDQGHSAKEV